MNGVILGAVRGWRGMRCVLPSRPCDWFAGPISARMLRSVVLLDRLAQLEPAQLHTELGSLCIEQSLDHAIDGLKRISSLIRSGKKRPCDATQHFWFLDK